MNDPHPLQSAAEKADAFIKTHLKELCQEIVKWNATGVRPEGDASLLQQLAKLMKPILHEDDESRCLGWGARSVTQAAMDFVAGM